jgi:elongation factor 1 alpha-like protein
VTIYLAAIDPIYVNLGCVLCEPKTPIPLASTITAQIVTFELKFPLTAGSSVRKIAKQPCTRLTGCQQVELFHHSKDTPATITKIEATLDKATGEVLKTNPR